MIEREYNIPLRREWLKVQKYKRAKKAMKALFEFLSKHMKVSAEQIHIGPHLNQDVWKRGIKNPPHHVKVTVIKEDDSNVYAELTGFKYEKKEKKEGKEKKEKKPEKLEEEFEKLKEKTEEMKKKKEAEGKKENKAVEKLEKKEEIDEEKSRKPAPKPVERQKKLERAAGGGT